MNSVDIMLLVMCCTTAEASFSCSSTDRFNRKYTAVEVFRGDTVRLWCNTTTPLANVNWTYNNGGGMETYIYYRGDIHGPRTVRDRFNATTGVSGVFTLDIYNAQVERSAWTDNGWYDCYQGEKNRLYGYRLCVREPPNVYYNVTASVGDEVRLSCNTSLREHVNWRRLHSLDDQSMNYTVIYADGKVSNRRFGVTAVGHDYSLAIHKVTLNDGGYYACIEDEGRGKWHIYNFSVNPALETSDGGIVIGIVVSVIGALTILGVVIVLLYRHRASCYRIINRSNRPIKKDIPLQSESKVAGVAVLNKIIYVANRRSPTLRAFDASTHQTLVNNDIVVELLQSPSDIAACPDSNCLYVVDYMRDPRAIWKVHVVPGSQPFSERWLPINEVEICPYHTLSVSRKHLLVTLYDKKSVKQLHLYNENRETVEIRLPDHVDDLYHAVWTPTHTFIVCYSENREKRLSVISEILADGTLSNRLSLTKRFEQSMFRYLAPVDDDFTQILVADSIKGQILLFSNCDNSENPQEQRVIVDINKIAIPRRVIYDQKSSRLYVVHGADSDTISEFHNDIASRGTVVDVSPENIELLPKTGSDDIIL